MTARKGADGIMAWIDAGTFGMATHPSDCPPTPVIPETAQRLSGISAAECGADVGVFAREEIPALRFATAGDDGQGLRPG
ncbi:hypothetical protein TVD_07035 [Thioalkalivibrio versutus]|uniref:Uncharacterized protein n=1 Tax=Thioalkalivibrio versutus TaxID=106634 RepID=A0A0G3G439_9GAMM|nr:hypothetical protein TVD_07035 [Thioalkalivibrio versutus]